MRAKRKSGCFYLEPPDAIRYLAVIIVILGSLLLPVPGLAECADAPEIGSLSKLLDKPEEIGKFPADSLSITPRSYIALQPAARKMLGQALSICPGIPINAKGNPLMPIKMDFSDIWKTLQISLAAGDWENAAFIKHNFRARPLPPEALFSLLTIPPFDEKVMAKFGKVFGIPPFRAQPKKEIIGLILHTLPKDIRFFTLDVFYSLGGQSTKKCRIGWSPSYNQIAEARSQAASLKVKAIIVPYSGYEKKMAFWSLRRCGVEAVELDNYFATNQSTRQHIEMIDQ